MFLVNTVSLLFFLNLSFIAAYHSPAFSELTCHGVSIIFHTLFLSSAFSLAGLGLTKLNGAHKKEGKAVLMTKCLVVSGVLATWCKSLKF